LTDVNERSGPQGQLARAGVIHGPGDLRMEVRVVPTPGRGEAVVAIGAVGICGSDLGYFTGRSKYTVKHPFVLGHEAAGTIVALGTAGPSTGAHQLAVGSRVAIVPGVSCAQCVRCGEGLDNLCERVRYLGSAATDPPVDGAMQERICIPLKQLIGLPPKVSIAVGALLEPLAVAEHAVRRAEVGGSAVLIMGGGAIGQLVAQVARAAGAKQIALCEVRPRRRALAAEHGVDVVATPAELEQLIARGQTYDVVLDATGNPAAIDLCLRAAAPGRGRVVLIGNLPAGEGLPAESLARAEAWATATFRFPGGLRRALSLINGGLDIEWLVEEVVAMSDLHAAMEIALGDDPPIKIQVRPGDLDGNRTQLRGRFSLSAAAQPVADGKVVSGNDVQPNRPADLSDNPQKEART
jgi:2-desacetyl-2-hydroxyethyl bacteriochlorophyllide A dehydrogenase